jgi:hypothetical protein
MTRRDTPTMAGVAMALRLRRAGQPAPCQTFAPSAGVSGPDGGHG